MAVSPTLASLAVTTLAKGARMTMRSASVLASASLASARLHWDMAAAYWALDMAPWLFKVVARARSRRAVAGAARTVPTTSVTTGRLERWTWTTLTVAGSRPVAGRG